MTTPTVAEIRAHLTRQGVNVSHLSDVDLLLHELDQANDLINKLNRRDEDRRANDTARARAIRTAARRESQDQFALWDAFVFESLNRLSGETVRAALYRAANLPGLSGGSAVADMREAAARALSLWEQEAQDLREGAGRYEPVNVARQQLQEIARLRKLITDHAVELSDHTRPVGSFQVCECAGCELIRAMDDVETSVSDAAQSAA